LNQDFLDMLSALNASGAEYLVIGAHALAAHGRPRATGDLDLWVRPTRTNAAKVFAALRQFGAPLSELSVDELACPNLVYQIGLPPKRIDVLTTITGVEFDAAWVNRVHVTVAGVPTHCIGRSELLQNKRALGRLQDLADVESLEND
jgi:hypothetical protein